MNFFRTMNSSCKKKSMNSINHNYIDSSKKINIIYLLLKLVLTNLNIWEIFNSTNFVTTINNEVYETIIIFITKCNTYSI